MISDDPSTRLTVSTLIFIVYFAVTTTVLPFDKFRKNALQTVLALARVVAALVFLLAFPAPTTSSNSDDAALAASEQETNDNRETLREIASHALIGLTLTLCTLLVLLRCNKSRSSKWRASGTSFT
jgi:hypothetical protein